LPGFEQRGGSGGDELHGIEPSVEQLDDVGPSSPPFELRDPVRPGEADVPAAEGEHLYDVLGFQHLRFGARQRHLGAIAAGTGTHADPRVGEQCQHALLHPAFGQAETERNGAWDECGHRSAPCWPSRSPPGHATPPQKRDAGPGGAGVGDDSKSYTPPAIPRGSSDDGDAGAKMDAA
jgi:hypothetical protein